uniref:F-box domain-containing protein n=2 Tax=Clytia hemisphaerica TaxID=252671 RepID=A0A7M5XMQ7_9CNID|eukprot:TCONS_00013123-protein
MDKIKLQKLPIPILCMIASLLPTSDVLNFRLVCKIFYEVTLCREVLKQIKVKARNRSYKPFKKFLTESLSGGRFIHLDLFLATGATIANILNLTPNVNNLIINIKDIKCFKSQKLDYLHALVLVDKDLMYFDKIPESKYSKYFQPLSELSSVKDLSLKCQGQSYKSNLIQIIIKSLKNVRKIHLESLIVNNSAHFDEFKDFLSSCRTITSWSFFDVRLVKKGVRLPETVTNYECTKCIFSLIDKQHCSLQRLKLASLVPYVDKIWKENSFRDLRYLELQNCFFYFNPLESCKKLHTLKLLRCHLPFYYLMKLSTNVKDNLKELTIQSHKDFKDEMLLEVLNSFKSLTRLTLINMNLLTPSFLTKIKLSKLKFIFIKDSLNFNTREFRDHIETMKNELSFTVVLVNDSKNVKSSILKL